MVATLVHQNLSTASPQNPSSSLPLPPASGSLLDLKKRAAVAGPGFFGLREDLSDTDRLALARQFAARNAPTPVYLLERREWTDRRARLFVAGEYADKGLTVTKDHLAAISAAFDAPVPILVEHADSPLALGYVTAIEHDGDVLFGTVTLSAEADALVRSSGATGLSVGLSPDLSRLVEVSLVRHPRVPDARLFSAGPRFETEIGEACGSDGPPEVPEPTFGSPDRQQETQATPHLDRLLSKGQLLPCQLDAAKRLLETGRTQFGGDNGEIRRLLIELLEARPVGALFSELAPAREPTMEETEEANAVLLMPEEAAFYKRHFPGLALAEILKRRK